MTRLQINSTRNFASKYKSAGNDRKAPTNKFKGTEIFLGAASQFNKFIPDLAVICSPFRSILKKDAKWIWKNEHEKAFFKVNSEVRKVAELTHFKRNRPLRIISDASKNGLEAVLQQCEENTWKPIFDFLRV